MIIAIANDHGGFYLKETIVRHLNENGFTVLDLGTKTAIESADYPDYAQLVSEKVIENQANLGILCCGTGIGMSISANKVPGIRAAVVSDVFSAQATKAHNNTNVLCLGERVIGEGLALMIVDTWLNATFEQGRHQRRVDKISALEKNYFHH
ncbi:ribose 5-phosphate isomerase B [Enterococcus sp. LJL99]